MKKIKLDLEDNEQDVLEKVTCGDKGEDGEVTGFPQLKESGGFEIMYCLGCQRTEAFELFLGCQRSKGKCGVTIQVVLAADTEEFVDSQHPSTEQIPSQRKVHYL